MAYSVIWSEKSQEQINQIINYLLDNWPFEVAEKFTDQMTKASDQLSQFPLSGRTNEKLSSVYELSVRPYHKIYYTVLEFRKEVYILNVIDTRQK